MERMRNLFEQITAPNFSIGNLDLSRNAKGEYINGVLEDHWQTFQEGAEQMLLECLKEFKDELQYEFDWDRADRIVKSVRQSFNTI